MRGNSGNNQSIGEEKINGVTFKFYVKPDGVFYVDQDDVYLSAKTLTDLKGKIRKTLRTNGAKVPITLISQIYKYRRPRGGDEEEREEIEFTDVLLVGLHASRHGNGRALCKDEATGESVQVTYETDTARRLTREERAEYRNLFHRKNEAEQAFETFKKSLHISAEEELEKAAARPAEGTAD